MTEENQVAKLINTQAEKKVLESVQSSVVKIIKSRVSQSTFQSLKKVKDE